MAPVHKIPVPAGITLTPAQRLVIDPVNFLQNNLLIVGDQAVQHPKQAQLDNKLRAKLTLLNMEDDGYTIRPGPAKISHLFGSRKTRKAPAEGLYRIVMASEKTSPADTFLSYICPYQDDIGGTMVLGGDADIMVTAEMTGCTFGIGSAAPKSGARMVMHANAKMAGTEESADPQAKAQRQMVTGGLGANATLWEPRQYRKFDSRKDIDTRSTIIGVRSHQGDWNFYAQKYNADPDGRTLLETVKIC